MSAPEKQPPRPTAFRRRPQAAGPDSKRTALVMAGLGVVVLGLAGIVIWVLTRPGPAPVAVATPTPAAVPTQVPTAPPATPTPAPSPVPTPADDGRGEFKARLEEKRRKGSERLEQARREIQAQREAETKAEAEFRARFAGKKVDVVLSSGKRHPQASISGFSFEALQVELEPGRGPVQLPWSLLAPETARAVGPRVYPRREAVDQYDLGRFFISRRLWKEGQAAVHEAAKLDGSLVDEVERIDEHVAQLTSEKGTFKVAVRQVPPDSVSLSYDFRDPDQAADWRGEAPSFAISDGRLVLESERRKGWTCSTLEFLDNVDVEGSVSGTGAFFLGFHGNADGTYLLRVEKDAVLLQKFGEDDESRDLARSEAGALKPEPQSFRLSVRGRRIRFSLGGTERISFDDSAPANKVDQGARGSVSIGVDKGRLQLAGPLTVTGRLDPAEIQKRVATVEMLLRRAVNPDLEEVEAIRRDARIQRILGATEGLVLSADDRWYTIRILGPQELASYDTLKAAVAEVIAEGFTRRLEDVNAALDSLVTRHPGFPAGWYLRGLLRSERGEMLRAREDFRKAVEIFPEFSEALLALARVAEAYQDYPGALELAEKAVEHRPDYGDGHLHAGEFIFSIDKSKGAPADERLRLAGLLGADGGSVLRLRRWIQVQTKGPRDLGCVHEHETEHYRVVTDISAERAKWYGERLEIVRTTYLDRFGKWWGGDPRPKPRIAIFNTREAFYTYSELSSTDRAERAAGHFSFQNHELVLFEETDLDETQETLYHEAFHHFASAMLKYPPYWWNEGTAEYMSALRIQDGKVTERARMLRGRLTMLQIFLPTGYHQKFEEIMNESPREFYSGFASYKYAQAWSMVHFLYEAGGGKHRPLAERYFEVLKAGKTQREAYDEVFKDKAADLEKEWLEYAKALKP